MAVVALTYSTKHSGNCDTGTSEVCSSPCHRSGPSEPSCLAVLSKLVAASSRARRLPRPRTAPVELSWSSVLAAPWDLFVASPLACRPLSPGNTPVESPRFSFARACRQPCARTSPVESRDFHQRVHVDRLVSELHLRNLRDFHSLGPIHNLVPELHLRVFVIRFRSLKDCRLICRQRSVLRSPSSSLGDATCSSAASTSSRSNNSTARNNKAFFRP